MADQLQITLISYVSSRYLTCQFKKTCIEYNSGSAMPKALVAAEECSRAIFMPSNCAARAA